MELRELAKLALSARENSYCPYSGFAVGAALLCEDGSVYTGCNVENAAFSPTSCAERTALFYAVSQGKSKFTAIAVAGGKKGEAPEDFCTPCGVCRQALSEFCSPELSVVLTDGENIKIRTLGELFPESFGAADLKDGDNSL